MFSVTSDLAASLSAQVPPPKAARPDPPRPADNFGSLVSQSGSDTPPSPAPQPPALPRSTDNTPADSRAQRDAASPPASRAGNDSGNGASSPPAAGATDSKGGSDASTSPATRSSGKAGKSAAKDGDGKAAKSDTTTTPTTSTASDATASPQQVTGTTLDGLVVAIPFTVPGSTATNPAQGPTDSTGPLAIAKAAIAATAATTAAATTAAATTAPAGPGGTGGTGGATGSTAQDAAAIKAGAQTPAIETGPPLPQGAIETNSQAPGQSLPNGVGLPAPGTAKAATTKTGTATQAATDSSDAADPPDGSGATAVTTQGPAVTTTGPQPTATARPAAAVAAEGAAKAANPDNTPAAATARDHVQTSSEAAATTAPDTGLQAPAALPAQLQAATPASASSTNFNVSAAPNAVAVPLSGLAVEIAASAKSGKTRFDIRLDPADLGRIDVRIDVDRNGQVTSHLTVEKPQTLSMLQQDAPQLQRALDDAGLKMNGNGLQFSLRDQSSSGQNNGDGAGNAQRLVISEDDTMPPIAAGRSYGRMLSPSGGVDIRV